MVNKEPYIPTFMSKLLSLLALTLISTTVGVALKLSQTRGSYAYSPASAVVFTELYKLLVTIAIVCNIAIAVKMQPVHLSSSLFSRMRYILTENVDLNLLKYEFLLSLMYAFVNVVTFPIFMYMSASMYFLMKTASPVVTAIMLRVISNRHISWLRWAAIAMQCVGLLVTQINFCSGTTTVPLVGYVLIVGNTISSCVAGVYNEELIKTHPSSLNTQNAILYCFGVIINTILHFLATPLGLFGMERVPGFFEGWGPSAIFVVIANGSVGLVISVIYKYSDIMVKTFGIACSTAFLFVLETSGFLPQGQGTTSLSATLFGSVSIIYASYVYILPETYVSNTVSEMKGKEEEDNTMKNIVHIPMLFIHIKTSEKKNFFLKLKKILNHRVGLAIIGLADLVLVLKDYGECL